MKRFLTALICAALVITALPCSAFAQQAPRVFLNGSLVSLKNTPYMDDGVWMVPFCEFMNGLGVRTEWDAENGIYKGMIGDIEASVKPGSDEEYFDLVDIELDRGTKATDNDAMVQLDYFEKLYGATVTSDSSRISVTLELPEEIDADFDVDAYLDSLTDGEEVFKSEQLFEMKLSDPNYLSQKVVEMPEGEKFDKVLQIDNYVRLQLPYESQVTTSSIADVHLDDIVVITFWARSLNSTHESGRSYFGISFERKVTWDKMFCNGELSVGSEWEKFYAVCKISRDIPKDMSQFCIRTGYYEESMQVADLKVINYGKSFDTEVMAPDSETMFSGEKDLYHVRNETYYGREEDALWRKEALKRIERIRVRDINVNVTDENGNPVPNAKAHAKMTRSEFRWGTMVEYNQRHSYGQYSIINDKFILQNFNAISEGLAHKYGAADLRQSSETANYAAEHNLYNRCHNIFWDAPKFMNGHIDRVTDVYVSPDASEDELLLAFAAHASRMLYNAGDSFDVIDVINEPVANGYFQEKYGRKFVADLFKIVRDICPDTDLLVNEAGMEADDSRCKLFKEEILGDYLKYGAPIDGVGFEAHFVNAPYPQQFYNRMSYVCEDVDKAEWTEFDYVSNLTNFADRMALEKDYFRDCLIIAYSHPKMTGFHMWGYADTDHWRGDSPLYDYSMMKKPCYEWWEKYVLGEWKTDTEGLTDESGSAKMRGHRGEYEITVEAGGKTATTTLVVSDKGINTVNAVLTADGIRLETSEPVVKKKIKLNYPLEDMYKFDDYGNMYKGLYRNITESVCAQDGTDISFLGRDISKFGEEPDNSAYALNAGKYIVSHLKQTVDSGVVSVKPADENEACILRVEVSDDGENWRFIGSWDRMNPEYLKFDGNADRVRFTNIGAKSVQINNIHTALKEWIR